ncbi:sugar phosphate isomerase/epimerase [Paenibacillus macerans]|uniref:sugar phosphate isomerase/epimerase family protein n=1 Tax=Paenibacillus macerans TaxID=44252 RepID=UPI002DBE2BA5|nr:sugar phosphate isomerase/epimerase family protein [Paenibacillus macerans]MEC0331319.1 sugar phosphate isomerase/epimerase [Paenibacillus macerans]MED4957935.1 sugar phosphate isomerase/epimerase [Paenibacillus macerans]
MKLSVFTVATPDLTPEELVLTAREAGLDGVEWRFKGVPAEAKDEAPSFWRNNLCSIDPGLSDTEMLRFKEITEAQGLEVVSVTPYLNSLNLEETDRAFRAARLLGAKMIRVGAVGYDGSTPYPELYEATVRYLKEAERMAKQYGVKGVVETHHNTIAPSAGLAHRLVSHCDPEYIGVLFDPGNMVHEGYERFKMGLELLGPYLAHVHVKNAVWTQDGARADGTAGWRSEWAPLASGIVDFRTLLYDLKSAGYDGCLGIEDFSGQYDSKTLLKAFAEFMRERM